jgi:hypothetical protein
MLKTTLQVELDVIGVDVDISNGILEEIVKEYIETRLQKETIAPEDVGFSSNDEWAITINKCTVLQGEHPRSNCFTDHSVVPCTVLVYMKTQDMYEFPAKSINNARQIAKRIITEGVWVTIGEVEEFYPAANVFKVTIRRE